MIYIPAPTGQVPTFAGNIGRALEPAADMWTQWILQEPERKRQRMSQLMAIYAGAGVEQQKALEPEIQALADELRLPGVVDVIRREAAQTELDKLIAAAGRAYSYPERQEIRAAASPYTGILGETARQALEHAFPKTIGIEEARRIFGEATTPQEHAMVERFAQLPAETGMTMAIKQWEAMKEQERSREAFATNIMEGERLGLKVVEMQDGNVVMRPKGMSVEEAHKKAVSLYGKDNVSIQFGPEGDFTITARAAPPEEITLEKAYVMGWLSPEEKKHYERLIGIGADRIFDEKGNILLQNLRTDKDIALAYQLNPDQLPPSLRQFAEGRLREDEAARVLETLDLTQKLASNYAALRGMPMPADDMIRTFNIISGLRGISPQHDIALMSAGLPPLIEHSKKANEFILKELDINDPAGSIEAIGNMAEIEELQGYHIPTLQRMAMIQFLDIIEERARRKHEEEKTALQGTGLSEDQIRELLGLPKKKKPEKVKEEITAGKRVIWTTKAKGKKRAPVPATGVTGIIGVRG